VGYQVILDIIGSAVIGGLLLLTLLTFNAQNLENKQVYRDEITAQRNLVEVVNVLEEDFRRIGYCETRSNMSLPVVTVAAAESIRFKTDLPANASNEGDGTVDYVAYALGGPVTSTMNPRDRMLLRRENTGEYAGSSMGVTKFSLRYLKYNGDTLAVPVAYDKLKEIIAVEVTLTVENVNPFTVVGTVDSTASVLVHWKQFRFEIRNFGKGAI
jgi:type II secretory pathway component PulJ